MMTFPLAESLTRSSGDSPRPAGIFCRSFSTWPLLIPSNDKPDALKITFALNSAIDARFSFFKWAAAVLFIVQQERGQG
jgi:hypothetical protein